MHVQSVSELLSKVNYVATRLRHLETIRWHVEWKLPPNELSPKIVLIYAVLLLKCRESNLRAFLIHNLNFARLFARLTPVFLLKKRPSFARLFTKMSPSEELVTLQCCLHYNIVTTSLYNVHNQVQEFFLVILKKQLNRSVWAHLESPKAKSALNKSY